jgi:ribonuclease T2
MTEVSLRSCSPCTRFLVLLSVFLVLVSAVQAQSKGEADRFDFYLLNLSWSPEFCAIQGTGPQCAARAGFLVHGLWPQNKDGSYPVSCSDRSGPRHPEVNLDITPDLSLLDHEWKKHGTCTKLAPEQFFQQERIAFRKLKIPPEFEGLSHEMWLKPSDILDMFTKANPSFPAGSFLVSCGPTQLTAVEVCLSKKGLKPVVCQALQGCQAQRVRIAPAS